MPSNELTERLVPTSAAVPAPPPSDELPTPLMQQYQALKARVPEAILFFHLGDFYEMFGADAHTAAPILEVVLTQRQGIPMCGVPTHAVEGYLAKLIRAGFRVAIADQQEDPALATGVGGGLKGLVKRDIVRVVTAGTLIEEHLLDSKRHNFLAALTPLPGAEPRASVRVGLAVADVSTGEFWVMEHLEDDQHHPTAAELARYDPRELLLSDSWAHNAEWLKGVLDRPRAVTPVDDSLTTAEQAAQRLKAYFQLNSLRGLDLETHPAALAAAGVVLHYLSETLHAGHLALKPPRFQTSSDFLRLDPAAIKHLELLEGLETGTRQGSLLEVLDHTMTPMGSRLLRRWLLAPLLDPRAIQRRLALVELWHDRELLRRRVRELLQPMADLERVLSRVSAGTASPRELAGLGYTLQAAATLRRILSEAAASPAVDPSIPARLAEQAEQLVDLTPLASHIAQALVDHPPARLDQGGVFRAGFHAELDALREIASQGKTWLATFEARERERTGIPSLKVGYNSV
ncbi:MAG: DNA mismatch repair protein MutS, partial [Elusimicrobia bacterium]|nr:DNA mismatch repair protein MutS [Elusimicrobiota bacterium]